MKKPVVALVVALVVVDVAALMFYLKHKSPAEAPAPVVAAAPTPAPAPEPAAPAAPSQLASGDVATPGGCKSIAECDAYCRDDAHKSECLEFLGPAGQAPVQEPQEHPAPPKKVEPKQGEAGGAPMGPGGCTSAAECQQFCADPGHSQECQSFGLKERKRIIARIEEAPVEVQGCIEEGLGERPYARFMAGKTDVNPALAKTMQRCFAAEEGETGPKPTQSGSNGPRPGGCKDAASCTQYCFQVSHAAECLKWKDLPPQFRGPLEQMIRDGH